MSIINEEQSMTNRVEITQIMYLRRLEITTKTFQIAERIVFSKDVLLILRL